MARLYPIRVASIPSAHPYVEHLSVPGDGRVVRLPDPPPAVPDPLPGQWWPPVVLDPAWPSAHRDEIDVVHLHFGFDSFLPAHLRGWTATLARLGVPLVLTVHDLVNPHIDDPAGHLRQLDVLVPAADAVITLTAGAAEEIRRRWARDAVVLPHPQVFDAPRPRRLRRAGERRIGVHVKNLRANIDALPVLTELLPVVREVPGAVLQVNAHPEVFDPRTTDPRRRDFARWASSVDGRTEVDLRVHPRLDDDALQDYLASLDLCVLPYRFGTHSGWLEACVDVGTPVLVPSVGHYSGQHDHPVYRHPGGHGTGPALRDQVLDWAADPGFALRTCPDRSAQRRVIADRHAEIYRSVLSRRDVVEVTR
ncbi:glycosyltransferase [Nakamurella sp. YIM 132087]|uniref:Glycosyltransferase n=1 Tax=Nakamurella alba TaxID=2665158 RepID=A0A7K1FKJ0_9ACTN|nr:glycosyltransferase [Nakamurella alba]MTD14606.1 glycosyltransferase [Nakamurella alba]